MHTIMKRAFWVTGLGLCIVTLAACEYKGPRKNNQDLAKNDAKNDVTDENKNDDSTNAIGTLPRDAWRPTSLTGAPSPRYRAQVFRSGAKIVVFGGFSSDHTPLTDGALYDPSTDSWEPIPSQGSERQFNAVSADAENLFIWGQVKASSVASGHTFSFATKAWKPISTLGQPSARYLTPAFPASGRFVVWGGHPGCNLLDGAVYAPAFNTWTPMAPAPQNVTAGCDNVAWANESLHVWGHAPENSPKSFSGGGIWDSQTNQWQALTTENSPSERTWPLLLANKTHFLVWSGWSRDRTGGARPEALANGAVFDKSTGIWRPVATPPAELALGRHPVATFVDEDRVFLWGVRESLPVPAEGGTFLNLSNGQWDSVSSEFAPAPRRGHVIFHVGKSVLIWGGSGASPTEKVLPAARFDLARAAWKAVPQDLAPSLRTDASVLPLDDGLFVWGGHPGDFASVNSGAIYRTPE